MTIKEITALRKSGRLPEALEAAETEFSQNANHFTANALFWCLYELLKQQEGEEASANFERMKELYEGFCPGNELMQKTLASGEQRFLPHCQEVKALLEKAKDKENKENLFAEFSHIASWFDDGSLDPKLYSDFGWLIFYLLRKTDLQNARERKILLNQYLKLQLEAPSMLHSLMLKEAVKVEQNTPLQFRIRDFVRMWNLENLRDEDWEQFHAESGNDFQSNVEKLISVYVKELKTDKAEAPEEFCQLVDKALEKYPNNQNMPYFKAAILIGKGKTGEALDYYKDMILRFPSKFYLWSQAAELVDDPDTKIGLLCKALTCGAEDEFVGGVRLKLAGLLIKKELKANARYELKKYRHIYMAKGWHLKQAFFNLVGQAGTVTAESNDDLYAEYAAKADEFIYSALPAMVAVKTGTLMADDRFHPGRKIATWILRLEDSTVRLRKPAKYGLDRRTPDGALFDIKMKDEKVVWIRPHEGTAELPWLKEGSGEVRLRTDRNGRRFAIVADSYVGDKLLKGIADGQHITILAARQKDGRWSAISILKRR